MIGITRGELNREVQIILIGTFLTVITYSAMIPYFAVFLKENLALQATAVSTILMVFLGLIGIAGTVLPMQTTLGNADVNRSIIT
jgi:predicted MFS family arabinose efflux permease